MRDALLARIYPQLRDAALEKLDAIARILAGEARPEPPPASPPESVCTGAKYLAEVEGEPGSGAFCIRIRSVAQAPAETTAPSVPFPAEEVSQAAKLLQLLDALQSERPGQKAPPYDVFMLRYRHNLSRRGIARECRCSPSLIAQRLRMLRRELPWQPHQLRQLSAQVEAMHEALSEPRARRIYRKGAVYGDEGEEED